VFEVRAHLQNGSQVMEMAKCHGIRQGNFPLPKCANYINKGILSVETLVAKIKKIPLFEN